jgi:hypothetical protein
MTRGQKEQNSFVFSTSFVHIYNVNLELNKTYSTTMHKYIMGNKTINYLNIFNAKN